MELKNIFKKRKIPLAWLLLTRQPLRILVAIAGIAFAGILMFMQLGFRDGLFDASVTVPVSYTHLTLPTKQMV